MRIIHIVSIATFISCAVALPAYSETQSADALNAITETADKICGQISHSGQNSEFKIGGDAHGELSGLAKKMLGMGASGSVDYNTKQYENVVQAELPAVLKNTQDCKLHIFNALNNSIFPPPVAAVTAQNITGDVNVSGNDLNGPEKVADVNGAASLTVTGNSLNKQNPETPIPALSTAQPPSKAKSGVSIDGATFVGSKKIADINGMQGDFSLTHAKQISDEKKFYTFPLAQGDLSALSADALKKLTLDYAVVLDDYEMEIDQQIEANADATALFKKQNIVFQKNYLPNAMAIASEWMKRLKKRYISVGPQQPRHMSDIKWGANIILDGKLSGPFPMHCVADFLRYLTEPPDSTVPPQFIELTYPQQ